MAPVANLSLFHFIHLLQVTAEELPPRVSGELCSRPGEVCGRRVPVPAPLWTSVLCLRCLVWSFHLAGTLLLYVAIALPSLDI